MTLNPKNRGFSDYLAIFGCKRVNCDKMDGDRPRLPASTNCLIGSRASHEPYLRFFVRLLNDSRQVWTRLHYVRIL